MLLTIDVGNTNSVLGVFRGEELIANWRLTTARERTVDEYGVLTRNLFALAGLDQKAITGVIISSVVPPVNWAFEVMSRGYFGQEALFVRAARLPRVEIKDPGKVIGTNTVTHMQAGLFYGAVDMVDGMLARMKKELGEEVTVVATGGQAKLVAKGSKHIQHTNEFLTLKGLRLIWEKNQPAERGKSAAAESRALHSATPAKKAQP